MTKDEIIKRFLPISSVRVYETGVVITLRCGETAPDGVCDVYVMVDDEFVDEFVSTQAEIKVVALAIAGVAIPKRMIEAAETAKRYREGPTA